MITVSDHAVVRYLERVMGMDINKIRKEILPTNVAIAAKALGNGYYPVGDTHKVRVKGGNVITILSPEMGVNYPYRSRTTRNKTLNNSNRRRMKRDREDVNEAEQWEEAGF